MNVQRALLVLAVLLVPATLQARMVIDHDRGADFSLYSTFSFSGGQAAPNPIADRVLLEAIDAELSAKGLKRVDEGADVHVVRHVQITEEVRIDSHVYGAPRFHQHDFDVHRYPVGTVIIDLVDADGDQVVWRARVTGGVIQNPEKRDKKIRTTVGKMFRTFPPKPAKER